MAKPIHMFELPVEIEPFRPGVERGTSLMSHIVVSAAVVAFCTRVTIAPAKLLEDLSGPPVEMGIDDPHDLTESITQRCSTVAAVYFGDAPRILKFKNSGCVPEIDRIIPRAGLRSGSGAAGDTLGIAVKFGMNLSRTSLNCDNRNSDTRYDKRGEGADPRPIGLQRSQK